MKGICRAILVGSVATIIGANCAQSAPKVVRPACGPTAEFTVVDFSRPVPALKATNGQTGLDALKSFGVTTIFRYYDMPYESMACKTLMPAETQAILAKGFRIGVVFQNKSDDPNTFIAGEARARAHAERALELAVANGQPSGSAIYFGVDGAELHLPEMVPLHRTRQGRRFTKAEISRLPADEKRRARWYNNYVNYRSALGGQRIDDKTLYPFVKTYFKTIRSVFAKYAEAHPAHNYKIGMYCTGALCLAASQGSDPLADYFWVTAEGRNQPEYKVFVDSGRWSLLQQRETKCPKWKSASVALDFNRASPAEDIGTWASQQSERGPIKQPIRCKIRN